MTDKENLLERIVVDPKIMVGKPIIQGTRIPVQYILELIAEGISFEEIIKEHPQLTQEDLRACVKFQNL